MVGNDGEREVGVVDLVDILDPGVVRVDVVSTQSNEFDAEGSKLRLELGEGTELGGADGGEVILQSLDVSLNMAIDQRTYRVREEDNPVVANELVKVNGTLGGLGLEVRGSRTQAERNTLRSGHYEEL